jgi:hypothetical protein
MTTDDRSPGLSEPLNERSRLVRRSAVQVGLFGDDMVLFQPDSLVACILDEQAAGLWLDCVGQPFSELIESAHRSFDAEPHDIFDLFRILRLFEMVGDSDACSTTDEADVQLCSPLPRCTEFRFRGELIRSGERAVAIIGSTDELHALELDSPSGPDRTDGPTTIVVTSADEETEHEVHGLEAITALARSIPDPQIDVLILLIRNHRVLLRPEPTD